MKLYEGMFVLDNRQANRDWEGSLDKLKGILSKHDAEIIRCEKWGERRLSYEIGGRRRATYVLTHFRAAGEAVNRIYRECELSDLILRALVLKAKTAPPEEQAEEPTKAVPEEAPRAEAAPQKETEAPAQEEPVEAAEASAETRPEAEAAPQKETEAPAEEKPVEAAEAPAETRPEASPEASPSDESAPAT